MDTTNAPQIIEHLSKSLTFTPFVTRWIPGTAKFVLCGQPPRANGIIEILQLNKAEMKSLGTIDQPAGVKCGAFLGQEFAFGDFNGRLCLLDLETKKAKFDVKAHDQIINSLDTCSVGAPEIVTASRDGCVRVWDPRQKAPVVSLEPIEKDIIPDAWSVTFGNAINAQERTLAAGYDNGDIKIFDLNKNTLLWDTNVQNGVCGIEFDRKDIQMNKLVATTLESKINIFDLRTFNAGYAHLCHEGQKSTIWGVRHLPQNRDIFATQGGNGGLNIYKYIYPPQRSITDGEGKVKGVIGKLELLNKQDICQQPISSLDWNQDKIGIHIYQCRSGCAMWIGPNMQGNNNNQIKFILRYIIIIIMKIVYIAIAAIMMFMIVTEYDSENGHLKVRHDWCITSCGGSTGQANGYSSSNVECQSKCTNNGGISCGINWQNCCVNNMCFEHFYGKVCDSRIAVSNCTSP